MELEGLPPTVNHMYRTSGKYRYKTSEAKLYQEYASAKFREVWQGKKSFTEPVSLSITFHTDNHKRWDIDNRVKALQDCLSIAGVIRDDTQIDRLYVERKYGSKTGTKVVLEESVCE